MFDTKTPFLVWEIPCYPAYYIPARDVRATLIASDRREPSPSRGEARYFHVNVGARTAENAAWPFTATSTWRDTQTRCPYKGTATYWSVRVEGDLFPDLVWTCRSPR